MKLSLVTLLALQVIFLWGLQLSFAQDYYVGQIFTTAASYCPYTTLSTNGQVLLASQYPALFNVIGTSYGSNGAGTFALPNLQPISTLTPGANLLSCMRVQ